MDVSPPAGSTRRFAHWRRGATVVVAIAALTAPSWLSERSATAVADGTRGKIAGMGISRPGVPQQFIANDLPRMRRAGINTGVIDVWWDVDRQDASTMHPGRITVSDPDLLLAMQRAKVAGMKVLFQPKLWCPSCSLAWRGELRPSRRDRFFESYRQFVNHYAELARQGGAEVFFIGTEMTSLQGATDEWREVARQAAARFGGRIAYEVNWDVLDAVKFWDAVDVVSVSAYFPLSDAERPGVADLKAAWHSSRARKFKGRDWFREVADLASRTGKSVLFGESGYLSSTFAAREPYNEGARYQPDMQVQADAYQALLETFESQPWWMGVVWWEWYLGTHPARDTNYTPRDKAAERLLTAWYVDGWRPPVAPSAPPKVLPRAEAPSRPEGAVAAAGAKAGGSAPAVTLSSPSTATSGDVQAAAGVARQDKPVGRARSSAPEARRPPLLTAAAAALLLLMAGLATTTARRSLTSGRSHSPV